MYIVCIQGTSEYVKTHPTTLGFISDLFDALLSLACSFLVFAVGFSVVPGSRHNYHITTKITKLQEKSVSRRGVRAMLCRSYRENLGAATPQSFGEAIFRRMQLHASCAMEALLSLMRRASEAVLYRISAK